MERVEMRQFSFDHLDIFAWREDDIKTYEIRGEISDALVGAAEKGECWTAVYDGRILAIGGILPRSDKTGYCFTLFSRYAEQHKIAAAKSVRQMFESMLKSLALHRVVTYNRIGADTHNRWCEWLGFKRECAVEKFDDDGNDYFQYALIR